MENQIMQIFEYYRLPDNLQEVCKPVSDLAEVINSILPDSDDKKEALNTLVTVRACLIKAVLRAE